MLLFSKCKTIDGKVKWRFYNFTGWLNSKLVLFEWKSKSARRLINLYNKQKERHRLCPLQSKIQRYNLSPFMGERLTCSSQLIDSINQRLYRKQKGSDDFFINNKEF